MYNLQYRQKSVHNLLHVQVILEYKFHNNTVYPQYGTVCITNTDLVHKILYQFFFQISCN